MLNYGLLMTTAAELIDTAMELSVADRSYIANKLIESIEDDRELSPAWREEIQHRVARRESGDSQVVSRESVHAQIENVLAR